MSALTDVDVLVAGGRPAGTGAAMAAERRVPPRELDVAALQAALEADGVPLRTRETC